MDEEIRLTPAMDEIAKVLRAEGVPPDKWPQEIGIRPGSTSVYVWDYQNPTITGENGNIYMSLKLLQEYPEIYQRKVGAHEAFHLVQEKVLGRDMSNKFATEAEAEAAAIKWMNGKRHSFGNRMTPLMDIATIKANPFPASTCFTPGSYGGISAGEACYCATFDFSEYEGRMLFGLLINAIRGS